jgi:colicin import membrane protein
MKNILSMITLAFLLVACSSEHEEPTKVIQKDENGQKKGESSKQNEAKADTARVVETLNKYVSLIHQKVKENWEYTSSRLDSCKLTVRVNLASDGKVLNTKVVNSSGDPYCDSSVELAFHKASPIPIPQDTDLYSEFKTIDFVFRP